MLHKEPVQSKLPYYHFDMITLRALSMITVSGGSCDSCNRALEGLCHTRAVVLMLPLTDPLVSKEQESFPLSPCPNSQAGTGTEG